MQGKTDIVPHDHSSARQGDHQRILRTSISEKLLRQPLTGIMTVLEESKVAFRYHRFSTGHAIHCGGPQYGPQKDPQYAPK